MTRVKSADGSIWKIGDAGPTPKAKDDPTMLAINAALYKQLLGVYDREGIEAVLANLRTKPAGTDATAQAIAPERERLLNIYEGEGREALLAELRK